MRKSTIYLRKTLSKKKKNPLFYIFSFKIFIEERNYCRRTSYKEQNKNVCVVPVHGFLISKNSAWQLCFMKTIEFLYTSQQKISDFLLHSLPTPKATHLHNVLF